MTGVTTGSYARIRQRCGTPIGKFDEVFWKHVAHTLRTLLRAIARSWTDGASAPSPDAGAARKYDRKLGRYSASFALTSDMALLTPGGAL